MAEPFAIEPWELFLHYTFTGRPGVIFDRSPRRRNHGRGVGLSPSHFLEDGAHAGTGSIDFRPNGRVQVVPEKAWSSLEAIKCEFVCICDEASGGGTLIDGGSFKFSLFSGTPNYEYGFLPGGSSSGFGPVYSDGHPAVPFNKWVQFSVVYDGVTGTRIYANGNELLFHEDHWSDRLAQTHRISIGSKIDGSDTWTGRIDDVKVWTLDPRYVDKTFIDRPMDPNARECWKRWIDALEKAFKDDPECTTHVRKLIARAIDALLAKALNDPATKAQWQATAKSYQTTWPTGNMDGIAQLLVDLIAATGGNLQLLTDPAFVALAEDECLRDLMGKLPPLDCDPAFTGMISKVAAQVQL